MQLKLPDIYGQLLNSLKTKIKESRLRAAMSANVQLLATYWEIGAIIACQEKQEGWGAKVVDQLARDLRIEFPDFKGLSARNLRYMREFALGWPELHRLQGAVATMDVSEILQQAAAKLPWFHICTLIDKVKNGSERRFYANKAIENGWSRNVLIHQIESNLFCRQGKAITNFEVTLPPLQSDLAKESLKNPYLFDFIGVGEDMHERELERALVQHMKRFLMELGKGFAYVGNQFALNVAEDDYYLDLLFYSYHLHCFVVFELKVGNFKPEYAGKLNFYINTINERLKGKEDKPTIGVLLCKTSNETVVKYALQGIDAPIGVTAYHFNNKYQLTEDLPASLQAELPSIEVLEQELEKDVNVLQKPLDKKLAILKDLITRSDKDKIQKGSNRQQIHYLFSDLIPQLENQINRNLEEIAQGFTKVQLEKRINHNTDAHFNKVHLEKELSKGDVFLLGLSLHMEDYKQVGIDTFSIKKELYIELQQNKYGIGTEQNKPWFEKSYHQTWASDEIQQLAERWCEEFVDEIIERAMQLSKT